MDALTIFTVYYAIIWSTVVGTQSRWKMFHYPAIFNVPEARNRLILSFLMFNVFPLAIFIYTIKHASLETHKLSEQEQLTLLDIKMILKYILSAWSIFGLYRVWVGVVRLFPTTFYALNENQVDIELRDSEPNMTTSRHRDKLEFISSYDPIHRNMDKTGGLNIIYGLFSLLIIYILFIKL